MRDERYWVYDWLDKSSATSTSDLRHLVGDDAALRKARDRAASAMDAPHSPLPSTSILAGAGLDLSGRSACGHLECRLGQVDELFRRAWLYFDQIVVSDEVSPQLVHMPDDPNESWRAKLLDNLQIAFHLREIGAESIVGFQSKSHRGYCPVHAPEALSTVGLDDLGTYIDEYIGVLEPDVALLHTPTRSRPYITYTHPRMGEIIHHAKVKREDIGGDPRSFAARDLAMSHISTLVADLTVATELRVPLGTVDGIHKELMAKHGARTSPAEVALELNLPVLENADIGAILKIREQEADAFEIFRARLRVAIEERLKLSPDDGAAVLAERIKQDVILPELYSIRRRLKKAQSSLAKKSGLGIGVGTLVTSCGLLTGLLPLAVVGVGLVAGAGVVPGQQYLDKKGEVELSDMFFLWHALQHGD